MTALQDALKVPKPTMVVCHYPVVGRWGKPFHHASHRLTNVDDVLELLHAAPHPPFLWVHGHIHH